MPDLIANYLTIDPTTGAVSADFTGHVHARGLDLDLSTLATPPDANKLRFLDTGGVSYAAVYATLIANVLQQYLRADSTAAIPAFAHLQAQNQIGGNTDLAEVVAHSVVGGTCDVSAQAKTKAVNVIDSNGNSGLLQIGHNAQSLAGQFTATFAGALNTRDEVVTHNFNIVGVKGFAIGYFGGTLATFCVGEIIATAANTVTFRTRTIDGTIPAVNTTKFMDYLIWTP